MKLQIMRKEINSLVQKIISSNLWRKLFVSRIDEEKMREYQDQHRLMAMKMRIF